MFIHVPALRTTMPLRHRAPRSAGSSVVNELELDIDNVGVSMIDNTPVEFAYARLRGIRTRISVEQGGIARYDVRLASLRIDNQLIDTPLAVLLRPRAEARQRVVSTARTISAVPLAYDQRRPPPTPPAPAFDSIPIDIDSTTPFLTLTMSRDLHHTDIDFYKYEFSFFFVSFPILFCIYVAS